jgi:DNA-directed RNA polymerase subunit alpha
MISGVSASAGETCRRALMRIRWRDFEIPSSVTCDQETRTSSYGKFVIEPFERGFGVTVGNSLRRILLSSLEGAAITSIKIDGVQHEFSTLTGVYEDVTDIVLNVKRLRLRVTSGEDARLEVFREKKGEISAGEIKCPPEVEILDANQPIASLTQDIPFRLELRAARGRGYATAEENSKGDNEIGVIWLDSSFSPVTRVRYKTEDTRVGQLTNYDRLILEIWTNGTIKPELALVEAAKILRKHLNPFIQYTEIGYEAQEHSGLTQVEEAMPVGPSQEEIQRKLDLSISALGLSVRAYNCLEAENIQTVRDLVGRTEEEMLKVRNFGKTSLVEIREKLQELGLKLGMPGLAGAAANSDNGKGNG